MLSKYAQVRTVNRSGSRYLVLRVTWLRDPEPLYQLSSTLRVGKVTSSLRKRSKTPDALGYLYQITGQKAYRVLLRLQPHLTQDFWNKCLVAFAECGETVDALLPHPIKSKVTLASLSALERENWRTKLNELQSRRCAICHQVFKLSLDHDHRTDEIRGLLCNPCNSGLGFFKDDLKLLEAAANYLRNPPAKQLQ